MRVLVVEDDVQIRTLVRTVLEQRDMEVTEAGTVAEARQALDGAVFDVVILDLTLPDGSGNDVLIDLHSESPQSHVIVLSGSVTEADRVEGLNLGADDYVVKPFSARELTARVSAVQRRRDARFTKTIHFGRFELDLAGRRLVAGGEVIEFTAVEFSLLAFLVVRAGHVFSRSELLTMVWKSQPGWQSSTTVTEHVRRIRAKIEADPRHPTLLRTVRGVGYRFDLPDPVAESGARPTSPSVHGRMITVQNRIVHANADAATLLGATDAQALIGAHVLDFVAAQSQRSAQERISRIASGQDTRSQVLLVVHADGTELPVEVTTSDAEWHGVAALEADLRHAADESSRVRHLVTGVISEVTDAVVITDTDHHVRSWNGAAERLYGWTEAEVLGRHMLDIVSCADDGSLLATTQADVAMSDRWHGETQQITRDGSVITVRASANVVRDVDGVPMAIVSVNRPVLDDTSELAVASGHDLDDLRRGLARGEFEVYYQPVLSLTDQHVVTVEALVRWNHPDAGLLAPASFIETAERGGAIHELGTFVLTEACRQVAQWRMSGVNLALSVNLSAKDLSDPSLVDHIANIVTSSGLDLDLLWLEVTETALVEDVAQASILLHQLAALGIGISIDDFGTGWASLTYLRQFPIHALKIDRSFVTGVDHDPGSATIVRSILALGEELGLAVIAEGIETAAEARTLLELGCTIGQGYLYGRPVPASDIDLTRMRPLRAHDGQRAMTSTGDSIARRSSTQQPEVVAERAPARETVRRSGMMSTAAAELTGEPVSETDAVIGLLRKLLCIRSAADAVALLQQAVHDLGGSVVLAAEAGPDAVLIDVSLGECPPLLPRADPLSVERAQIERIIPRLVEDARRAIDLLRHHELLPEHSNTNQPTGL